MRTFAAISALFVLLISSCAVPLDQVSGHQRGLTVQAKSPGRAIIPSMTLTYDLTLTSAGQTTVTQTDSTTGVFYVPSVAPGVWDLQVDAYSNGSLVATGIVSKSFALGDTDNVVVPLAFSTVGTADLSLKVYGNKAPSGVASAIWQLRSPINAVISAGTFDLETETLEINLTDAAAGAWTLDATFYSDSHNTLPVAQIHETLVVLDGQSVYPPIVLQEADFTVPGQPPMVDIPSGTLTYGSALAKISAFSIGKYEITQAQFQAMMGFNPSYFNNDNTGAHANPEATWAPVDSVSLWDAMDYCNRLSAAAGLDRVYTLSGIVKSGNTIIDATVATDLTRNGYRLPTDAEWEYAARGGTTAPYPWGSSSDASGTYSWNYESAVTHTSGVGQKAANMWGLYDMFGNVRELTNDWYAPISSGTLEDYSGPATPSYGSYSKVYRGGAYNIHDTDPEFYAASRNPGANATETNLGFRVARREEVLASYSTIPSATLDQGYGRFLYVEADQSQPGKFLVSGLSGLGSLLGFHPTSTELMARFSADGALDATFGNNTDGPLNAALGGYGPTIWFASQNQNSVIQVAYDQSYYSGFAQNAYGIYVFQTSNAGGWNHTEVFRHSTNGILDLGYYQPVYVPGNQYYFPMTVEAQFWAMTPPAVDAGGNMYSVGWPTNTANLAINRFPANGAFPWQNDAANYENRYYESSYDVLSFVPRRPVVQPDNKLLLIGNNHSTENEGRLIRIDVSDSAHGALDTGFANAGVFTFLNGNADGLQRKYAAVNYWSGKIYLAGTDVLATSFGYGGFVIRLNDDGSFDTTFAPGGNGGSLNTPATPVFALPDPFCNPEDMAITSTGIIVVVGHTFETPSRAFAAKLSPNGAGVLSIVYLPDDGAGSNALSVAIDAQDRIAVAGYVNVAGGTDARHTKPALWRL